MSNESKTSTGTTIGIIVSVLAILALSLAYHFRILDSKSVLPAIAQTMLATFFGATFAFKLNSFKDWKKLNEDHLNAFRVALFILAQQQNALQGIWLHLAEWEHRIDRIFNLEPVRLPDFSNLKQDYSSLMFMLKDNHELLLELTIEDQRFMQVITSVTFTSEFFVDELHPTLSEKGLHKKETTLKQAQELIGPILFTKAKKYTDQIFTNVPDTIQTNQKIANKVFNAAKLKFPNEKFLKAEFITQINK
jgi:hypothetical protein